MKMLFVMPRWFPLLLVLSFVTFIVYVADTRVFPGFFRWVNAVPGLDKAGHFILTGMLAWCANLSLRHRRTGCGPLRPPMGSLIITVIVAAEEYSQQWFPARSCDWRDFAADCLGILCASFLSPDQKK